MTKTEIRQEKMNRLAKCFDASTGTKTGRACTGKWIGTTDYSVTFNNGNRFFISNGMKDFDEGLDYCLKVYEGFTLCKERIIEGLRELEIKDNIIASEKGLKNYHIIDVNYIKDSNDYIGWFYVTFEIDGKTGTIKETGLNYSIREAIIYNDMNYIIDSFRANYFVAGGVKDEDVEYVFHGVGHNTNSYTVRF